MFAGAINWFAPYLCQIAARAAHPDAHLTLTIRIFVTCLCDPGAVPRIPGCTVTEARPSVTSVLAEVLDPACASLSASRSSSELELEVEALPTNALEKGAACAHAGGGGVAVFAAGPASLIRVAGNAVVRANLSARGRKAGGVAFCAEAFTV